MAGFTLAKVAPVSLETPWPSMTMCAGIDTVAARSVHVSYDNAIDLLLAASTSAI